MKRVYNFLGRNHKLTDKEFRKFVRENFWEFRDSGDTRAEAVASLSEILNVSIETIENQIIN